jgi:hypothetical protein
MRSLPKTVDGKGRLTLGKAFANQLVIVREVANGVVEVIRAKAVPDPEIWLHSNPRAIRMVLDGLEEARARNLVDGPDIGV